MGNIGRQLALVGVGAGLVHRGPERGLDDSGDGCPPFPDPPFQYEHKFIHEKSHQD